MMVIGSYCVYSTFPNFPGKVTAIPVADEKEKASICRSIKKIAKGRRI
jgi:hypothetical protein